MFCLAARCPMDLLFSARLRIQNTPIDLKCPFYLEEEEERLTFIAAQESRSFARGRFTTSPERGG